MPRAFEIQGHRAITIEALGLIDGTFIPIEAEPFQAFQNGRGEFGLRAVHIRIFDAEDQNPAHVAREKPVVKRRARTPHVKVPRG